MKRNKLTFEFLALLCALGEGKERTVQLNRSGNTCEFGKITKRNINI
jgi:hypothetical protein